MTTELITASRTVQASPDAVWAAVTDLDAIGERSPQCRKMFILGGTPGVGTTTLNLNRRGVLFWPTWSKITRWSPTETLEWRIPINGSHWRFELTDNGDGTTELTESRIVDGDTSLLSRVLVATALGGNDTFEGELREGIEQTLAAIASSAERAG
ncbi:MAG: SRPBCC family protein [Corynebacterium sp.]|uniref:SRPBCC family protein n=1 Tax=unclassified Corynebacterium TaxID=2624378 RepID=UPI0026479EF9|nr:SRPBCC family protein [Corynebacterium sp.]MDN5582202.1 SRPBCC family protein [Corynebacterium sp.]MDN5721182.1 SRPBCC family protein [Corynebacterium sp.]MDN6325737.1 SRPBCC family protein [Corynebacterium sp.]